MAFSYRLFVKLPEPYDYIFTKEYPKYDHTQSFLSYKPIYKKIPDYTNNIILHRVSNTFNSKKSILEKIYYPLLNYILFEGDMPSLCVYSYEMLMPSFSNTHPDFNFLSNLYIYTNKDTNTTKIQAEYNWHYTMFKENQQPDYYGNTTREQGLYSIYFIDKEHFNENNFIHIDSIVKKIKRK